MLLPSDERQVTLAPAQGSLTRDLPLPGLGSVRSFSGRRQDTEIFFSYTDFATPGANYRSGPHALLGLI